MKSNFTQALRELTGFDGKADSQETYADKSAAFAFKGESKEERANTEAVTTVRNFQRTVYDSNTCITKTMTITGNIKSDDDIYVDG